MGSTAQSRQAKRDYWTRPDVVRNCRVLDHLALTALVLAVMLLGSINL